MSVTIPEYTGKLHQLLQTSTVGGVGAEAGSGTVNCGGCLRWRVWVFQINLSSLNCRSGEGRLKNDILTPQTDVIIK